MVYKSLLMHAIPIEFCIFAATSNTVQMHENYKESIPSISIQEIDIQEVVFKNTE